MQGIRKHLSYANVMATLGVFLALGGTAAAFTIGKNSVKSKSIAKGAVKTSDIHNGAVTKAKLGAGLDAGSAVQSQDITVRVATAPMTPGSSAFANAFCHADEKAIGGGAEHVGGSGNLSVSVSAPITSDGSSFQSDGGGFTGWRASENNPAGGTQASVIAQVLCVPK